MLRMAEREYAADSWMVRRWDKLVSREPHSFCEFWRTVTVIYTLRWLLGLIAVPTSAVARALPQFERAPREPSPPSRFWRIIRRDLRAVFGVVTWPFRLLFRGFIVAVGSTVEFYDDHRDGLSLFAGGLLIMAAICMAGYLLYLLLFTVPWSWDFLLTALGFCGVMIAIIASCFAVVWVLLGTKVGSAIGGVVFGTLRFLCDAAYAVVVQKRRVCPPMRINRGR